MPHLRTRVEAGGMNYKGYNIAVHELGHNVEQIVLALRRRPHAAGGRAQHRVHRGARLRLPGARPRAARRSASPTPRAERLRVLNDFWETCEIAGVGAGRHGRVALDVRRTPTRRRRELRDGDGADLRKDTWNQYYAPVLGGRTSLLLGIYSHMIDFVRCTCSTIPLGHLIAFQIEEHMRKARAARARSSSAWPASARSRPICG